MWTWFEHSNFINWCTHYTVDHSFCFFFFSCLFISSEYILKRGNGKKKKNSERNCIFNIYLYIIWIYIYIYSDVSPSKRVLRFSFECSQGILDIIIEKVIIIIIIIITIIIIIIIIMRSIACSLKVKIYIYICIYNRYMYIHIYIYTFKRVRTNKKKKNYRAVIENYWESSERYIRKGIYTCLNTCVDAHRLSVNCFVTISFQKKLKKKK